jgi:hypothetical protein
MEFVGTIAESVVRLLPSLLPLLQDRRRGRPTEPQVQEQVAKLGNFLTGRLVYLLRYLDQTGDVRYPQGYGSILSAYVDVSQGAPQPATFPQLKMPGSMQRSTHAGICQP